MYITGDYKSDKSRNERIIDALGNVSNLAIVESKCVHLRSCVEPREISRTSRNDDVTLFPQSECEISADRLKAMCQFVCFARASAERRDRQPPL